MAKGTATIGLVAFVAKWMEEIKWEIKAGKEQKG